MKPEKKVKLSLQTKIALILMGIFVLVTSANYLASISFTSRSITETMEHELYLATDIADTVIATKIELIKSNAETIAERVLKAKTVTEMNQIMEAQADEFPDFLSFVVLDKNSVVAKWGDIHTTDDFFKDNDLVESAFNGMKILSSPHYDTS
ncbi:MAG: hypothetical protein FWG21_04390, partial [Oscillospiraceae bacterium]|nr:hypothetical protein [Oscillospiraceae bacterium]